ncbi:MAG: hypothetical protein ABSF85_05140 [Terriglobales bacterium]|jgi:hypothetical protein
MKSKIAYISFGIIFCLCVAAIIFLPVGDVVRTLAPIPAIGSLLAALLLIFRDNIAYERSLLLLERQNSFSVGTTSHMANIAFDKYAQFAEEYVSEVLVTLTTLFRRGPCTEAFEHASTLRQIRNKWIVWLTPEIEATLNPFEDAIHRIGNCAHLVDQVPGAQPAITEMFRLVAEVIGNKEWDSKPLTGDIAVGKIVERIREILGIHELMLLRSELVKRAAEDLRNAR